LYKREYSREAAGYNKNSYLRAGILLLIKNDIYGDSYIYKDYGGYMNATIS
jgi:hypothetical protein